MDNCDIKVTVIIPIYNAAEYLRPALDSVIDQTLKEIEIICIDDGSTDNSLEIIKEYQKNDERIRIVTETNGGPALARNNGIRRARGEYVAFLDADDFFELDMLENMYAVAKANDLDIAIANYDIYNSHKSVFTKPTYAEHEDIYTPGAVTSKNEYPDYIFSSTNGSAWNKLFSTKFIIEKKLTFLTEVRMYEDVYFMITALSLAERVGKVHKTLIHHRIYSEQSRAKMFKKYFSQVPEIYLKAKEFLMSCGMYAPLSVAFLNLSASRLFKIFNILPHDEKEDFWNLLNSKYVESLGWRSRDNDEYEDVEVCEFVANLELYTYKQYRKRLLKGNTLVADKINKARKNAKFRKAFTSMFSWLVPKKKTR